MNKNLLTIAGASFVSLAVGAAGGYLYARKQLTDVYQIVLEEEIERTRAYYRQRNQTGGFETALDAAAALIPDESMVTVDDFRMLATELGYVKADEEESEDVEDHNIFDGTVDPDEDIIAEEEAARSPDEPYVISVEEYMNGDSGCRQFTLTYFAGDDTLVDEHEKPILDTEEYIGSSVLRFGYRSKDQNTVYIRNEAAELELEVIRSHRSYSEDVLGFVKKKAQPKMRKQM